ncbi:MAG: hypothetical protein EP300_03640 [Gammaproteobacteria bacterium]|nr:MAG: hypothetical protein EP300_03640 [Gammaproteobacteria bacterium]
MSGQSLILLHGWGMNPAACPVTFGARSKTLGSRIVGCCNSCSIFMKYQDCRADLALIRIPIKLILGERDRLVPIELKPQIADLAPGIQVESVAGAAHAPFLSHPTRVAALL